MQKILDEVRANPPELKPMAFDGLWKGLRRSVREDFEKPTDTTCNKVHLQETARVLSALPDGFSPHRKLKKIIDERQKMVFETEVVDWGTAELLSYGSLIKEGTSVRLSGQDVGRGTFTHRH